MAAILPTGDTGAAIKFLHRLRSHGPWVLSCDAQGFPTRTFDGLDDARAWIEPRQAKYNMYFTIAETKHPISKKASKGDISESHWVWTDIDLQKSIAERDGIYSQLISADPRPTIIIDSGGGFWGLWELDEAIDPAETERLNKILQAKFNGADHCFNCDRVARLPGTVNLPNENKRAKGQTPRVARCIKP